MQERFYWIYFLYLANLNLIKWPALMSLMSKHPPNQNKWQHLSYLAYQLNNFKVPEIVLNILRLLFNQVQNYDYIGVEVSVWESFNYI